jgi:hypothetical protein
MKYYLLFCAKVLSAAEAASWNHTANKEEDKLDAGSAPNMAEMLVGYFPLSADVMLGARNPLALLTRTIIEYCLN